MNTTFKIQSDRPATERQIRTFVANAAADIMFTRMLSRKMNRDIRRQTVNNTSKKVYNQVKESLLTAIDENPELQPNQGDMQKLTANLHEPTGIGFDELFKAGFQAMRATPKEIGDLLVKDGVTAAKVKKAVTIYSEMVNETVEKTAEKPAKKKPAGKRKASIKVVSNDDKFRNMPDEQKADLVAEIADKIETMQKTLAALNASF